MQKYNPKSIESKWQNFWEKNKLFEVKEDKKKQKCYLLVEFPYPSAAGLHVGHPRSYTAMDIIARKKRMEGYNVLYPMGFDAFGLPTENFAIKTGRPPAEVTAENIKTFTSQLKMLGYSFDWSRAVNTTDPKYYKWTQWIFLQFFKHGLAYKAKVPINWCLSCKIGLANEEVIDGKCERCGGAVEKRDKEQWMLAITKYADKLLEGLKEVDYIPQAKIQQENWIGRSEGALVQFRVIPSEPRRGDEESFEGKSDWITKDISNAFGVNFERSLTPTDIGVRDGLIVFTTRPDTLFGATHMVVAPEHELIKNYESRIKNYEEVKKYIEKAKKKSDLERTELQKEKTGVKLEGLIAVNPVNNEEIPIFVADYVLMGYGTGAIMAVPAHDERDWEFAKKYKLPIKEVVQITDSKKQIAGECFAGEGLAVNSGFLNGLKTVEAKEKIIKWLEEKSVGKRQVQYKLRDWVFSRQRYWGEPIPLVHCEKCKNRKYNYIIIHGFTSNSQRGFKPWLKSELEKEGHLVYSPDLPNTNNPNIEEQARFILDNAPFKIDKQTVLVGHSLGGAVIYRLLEKINIKIAKAVLVDPVYKPKFHDQPREAVVKSCNWNFDFRKIKNSAKEFIILGDKNFPIIKEEHLKELSAKLDCGLYLTEPAGGEHFSGNGGEIIQEPEVLKSAKPSGWVPIPDSELPVELPKVKKYEPTDTGESPLANVKDWVNVACPACGSPARRETDVMPNWAGSSWYFLRYCDPDNRKQIADSKKLKYWTPVDWYNGGMEHTVLHLLYSRFWNQFLHDIGAVPTREPYKKRTSHGMILGEDGEKMSKSRGNVVNPDEMVEKFGADGFRLYIMFMGPFDQAVAWDTNGLVGVRRFLERVWNLQQLVIPAKAGIQKSPAMDSRLRGNDNRKIETLLHQTIKKVTEDIEAMHFNTAISQLMILANEMSKQDSIFNIQYSIFIKLLSPFAPHIAEELYELTGGKSSISYQSWPEYNPELIKDETITIAVQVNGKLRETLEVPAEISEEDAKSKALSSEKVQKWMEGREPKKIIYVQGRMVSIVV